MKLLSMSMCFLVLAGVFAGCGGGTSADRAYTSEIEAWRTQRLERLTAEDGWLSVVGLFWLSPGENLVGSDPDCGIRLEGVPPEDSALLFSGDGTVWLLGGTVTLDGETVVDARALRADADGEPDVLSLGPYRFHIIERGDRLGVRVKNPDSPARAGFRGIESFAVDPAYRIETRLEPYDTPREIAIATVIGTEQRMLAPGVLRFRVADQEQTLLPLVSEPDETDLFIVFRDATGGKETYGAGRFLSAELEADGRVVLDFNRAVNPPCAFTPHATCPLPPGENILEAEIRAGEKYSSGDHG